MPVVLNASDLGIGAILLAVAGIALFLLRTWVISKVQEHVKESVRWRALRRERAVAIADFLALWVAGAWDPAQRNNARLLEVQRAYWELALWLDDATLRTLNRALVWEGDYHDALIEVRAALLEPESVDLESWELIRWNPHTTEEWATGLGGDEGLPPSPVVTKQPPAADAPH